MYHTVRNNELVSRNFEQLTRAKQYVCSKLTHLLLQILTLSLDD